MEHFLLLERYIEVASLIHVPLLRCFSFWREGNFNENLPKIADILGKAADICKERKSPSSWKMRQILLLVLLKKFVHYSFL